METQSQEIAKQLGGALGFAQKAWEAADRGQMSQYLLGVAMQEIAQRFFDGSMSKMLDSEIGKIFLQPRQHRVSSYEQSQFLKREGHTPKVQMAQHDHNGSDDEGVEEPFDKKVARLMKERGLNFDQAATESARTMRHGRDNAGAGSVG